MYSRPTSQFTNWAAFNEPLFFLPKLFLTKIVIVSSVYWAQPFKRITYRLDACHGFSIPPLNLPTNKIMAFVQLTNTLGKGIFNCICSAMKWLWIFIYQFFWNFPVDQSLFGISNEHSKRNTQKLTLNKIIWIVIL